MNVEGGGISAGGGGPSIGGGVGVSAGPTVGAPGGKFGPGTGIGSTIVNEGPVAPAFLENTMPLSFNKPLGEIIFNPEPKAPDQTISVDVSDLPSGAEAVSIAEKWLGFSKPSIVEATKPVDLLWKQPAVLPKIQPNIDQIELSKSLPASDVLTVLDKKSAQENVVGQVIDETPTFGEREEVEELKLKDLLDEETVQQRVYEIGEAIDLAETEAKKEGVEEIEGWCIIKFLRIHIGLISQIARKIRKDGSLDETLEELAASRFSSKNQAKAQTKELVFVKEPVKRGKEGKKVKEGAVERVFKHHQVSRSPKDEVVTRVVKKQIQTGYSKQLQVSTLEPIESTERRIEDTPLAEVFLRKAA